MPKPSDFEAAYTAAHYLVFSPQLSLRVGEKHPSVDDLLTKTGHSCWAFLTAENPYSEALSPQQNQQRTQQLARDLKQMNLPVFNAEGQDPNREWPPESSFLILGLDLAHAQKLAIKYQQHAYLWGRLRQKAKLVWTNT